MHNISDHPSSYEIDDNEEEEGKHNESLRNQELDQHIREQSEESQAQFLQGAIPKVVYRHALAGSVCLGSDRVDCKDDDLPLRLIRLAREENNVFVEQYILHDLLNNRSLVILQFLLHA